ncbi:hypothetical protein RFI_18610 [Reticulomyxa filosa]|uniref:Uncharacterized protein n=1 Tax=Reticulomyxa filosa TaxID=46433 RepID=X6N001_RETFI|nr:hypothetical protein RFI_18610 [Reticulomyxa filosa]|eukprot:ETO18652.1 hypothetical protein RFI_18610 [Reticulomyxa filosa]
MDEKEPSSPMTEESMRIATAASTSISDEKSNDGSDTGGNKEHICNALGAIVDDGPLSVMRQAMLIHCEIALYRFLSALLMAAAWGVIFYYGFNSNGNSSSGSDGGGVERKEHWLFGWNRLSHIWHVTVLVENVFGFGILYCWYIFKDLLRMWHFRYLRFDPRFPNFKNILTKSNVFQTFFFFFF